MRFAFVLIKLAVVKLVKNYDLSLEEGFELKLDKTLKTLRPEKKTGIPIQFKRL